MSDSREVTPVLIVDIDSTVRYGYTELGIFINTPEQVKVFPEAVERMQEHKERGGRIFGVSNQGGIAEGHTTETDVHANMVETNKQTGNLFDDLRWCPHYPRVQQCWCRKPRPGMALDAIGYVGVRTDELYLPDHTLFVGDREEDRLCAEALGVKFQWAEAWRAGQ
jgi:D-glycero-D-manno-heptose 1,7-bisphosphate phosphatase